MHVVMQIPRQRTNELLKKRRIRQLAEFANISAEQALAAVKLTWFQYRTINDQVSLSHLEQVTSMLLEVEEKRRNKQAHDRINMTWVRIAPEHKKPKRNETKATVQNLSKEELSKRILRPLLKKGKNGRNHTTPFESLYGHGIPDHQKEIAKKMAENWLTEGVLAEKQSQGRRHVWICQKGLEILSRMEEATQDTTADWGEK